MDSGATRRTRALLNVVAFVGDLLLWLATDSHGLLEATSVLTQTPMLRT
ncbi:hypothetical protein [Streptomyces sp. Root369]|nr:hypothetical protein [Streptomyces sp. Root369]